jgi:hypothetical protein
MLDDLRTLGWLRWRQVRDALVYGLRLLGYESGERVYALYLVGILGFWVFAMFGYAFDRAVGVGTLLTDDGLTGIRQVLPYMVLAGQIWILVGALRSTPLKLTFADMAYVAGSPVNPAAAVLLGFARQVALRMVLFTPVLLLLAALFNSAVGGTATVGAVLLLSFQALIPTYLLIILTWGTSWLLGTLRLVYPALRRVWGLWLLPLLLLPLAAVARDLALFTGNIAFSAMLEATSPVILVALLVVDIVVIVGLAYFGSRIDMIRAVDESQLYARIQSLGLLAWRQPDLTMRIRMQSGQRGRRAFLHLPTGLTGGQAVMARAALTYIRHPFMLAITAGWGALMTLAALAIGASNLPIQLVVGWVVLAGFAPPIGLLYVFRNDVEEPFLRQLIPLDGAQLLFADALLPLISLVVGAGAVWISRNPPPDVLLSGLLLIFVFSLIILLCGALGATKRERALQTRLIATIISFAVIGVGFGALGLSGLMVSATGTLLVLFNLVTDAM